VIDRHNIQVNRNRIDELEKRVVELEAQLKRLHDRMGAMDRKGRKRAPQSAQERP
jgi:prefoldin subunit 5